MTYYEVFVNGELFTNWLKGIEAAEDHVLKCKERGDIKGYDDVEIKEQIIE